MILSLAKTAFYSGICGSHKPARKVPTSVHSQKMTVMKILDKMTREYSPQSSRHSQLHPVKQHFTHFFLSATSLWASR